MLRKNISKSNKNGLYSLKSSLFISYLSSLVLSYFIYGFISYQFRVLDFIGENAAVEHPLLLVVLSSVIFIALCLVLLFDRKKISVFILHLFSFLALSFLFIQANKDKWLEYENTLYTASAVLLLSLYFAWLVSRLKIQKPVLFAEKYSAVILAAFCVFYFFYFSNLAIERHHRFYSQLYDLGWEHQALHNLAATGVPYSTVESKEGIINWADHTSFIYYLIAPFYKLFPSVEFMLVIQTLAVVLAAVFIFLFSKSVLKNGLYALIISAVFLLHPAVQGYLLADFHPSVIALPFFFLVLLFAEKNNFKGIFAGMLLLSLVREDFIFFSFFAAAYLFMMKKTVLKNFLWLIAMLFAVSIVSGIAMHISGAVAPDYARFYFLTDRFWGIVAAVAVNPLFIFMQLFDADKINFLIISSLPLLFLFFLHKPSWLLLLPAFLFTVFSRHTPHYLTGYHYSVMLVCAAFAGIVYYLNERQGMQKHFVIVMFVLIFFMNYFYGNIFSKSLRLVYVDPDIAVTKPDFIYKQWQGYYKGLKAADDREIIEFIKALPADTKVAADQFIAAHASARRYLYHLKNYDWADVIIDRKSSNAEYKGFLLVKETKLWKAYKRM